MKTTKEKIGNAIIAFTKTNTGSKASGLIWGEVKMEEDVKSELRKMAKQTEYGEKKYEEKV